MFRLVRLLFLLLLTYPFVVQAADAPSITPHKKVPTNCVDGCSKRTLFDIIWSCVSTTIICAWAAIHPNIPPREGPVKGTLRRLELMLWTIVVPEILPAWALNQLLAAMTIRDMYNKERGYEQEKCNVWKTLKRWFSLYEIKEPASQGWTLKHGFFLIMGGFHLVEPVVASPEATTSGTQQTGSDVVNVQSTSTPSTQADAEAGRTPSGNNPEPEGRITILTLEMLQELVKDPEFRIRITEEGIADRSKGDALFKMILIFQSSWFIIQCIARHIQGLSLTQMELTTAALASLNGITFILWLDKPLGVQDPVRLYMNRNLTDAERDVAGERGLSDRSKTAADNQKFLEDGITAMRNVILCRSENSQENIFVAWLILPLLILLLLLTPITVFFSFALATITDVLEAPASFPADARRVPTFYVPKHRYSKVIHILLMMTLGTIFGAIHCAGWELLFPTHGEQTLWRDASLLVTIIPIVIPPAILITNFIGVIMGVIIAFVCLIFCLIARLIVRRLGLTDFIFRLTNLIHCLTNLIHHFTNHLKSMLFETITYISETIAAVPGGFTNYMFLYTSARLVLLGLALALLRHQPPDAFIAVDWTKFYPHIF